MGKNLNKLAWPIAIVLAATILGGFILVTQINKQQSIERQQQIELQAKNEVDSARQEKDRADAVFSNNLKCQTLLKDLRQRWNNVVGIYYSEWLNTCMVKYTQKGETEEAPIESMEDNP